MKLCWPSPRRIIVFVAVLLVVAATAAAPAIARDWHDRHRHEHGHHRSSHHHSGHSSSHRSHDWDDSDHDDDGDENTTVLPDQPVDDEPAGGTVASGTAQTITARLTGYSWQDNTPPGSATISMPVLHRKAGGTGTYADPITTAVPGSASSPETPKGTRIYVAKLKRYFIVEDSGASKAGKKHFDLWVGGEGFPKSASDRCMNSYTGDAQVILNPKPGLLVKAGQLTGPNGCDL